MAGVEVFTLARGSLIVLYDVKLAGTTTEEVAATLARVAGHDEFAIMLVERRGRVELIGDAESMPDWIAAKLNAAIESRAAAAMLVDHVPAQRVPPMVVPAQAVTRD